MTQAGIWWRAIRPGTLWAAVAPVLVGSAAAAREGAFAPGVAAAALAVALCLQVAANLSNDVDDFESGADTERRQGPLRVTQAGLLSPRQVRLGAIAAFVAATVPGLLLVLRGGWSFLALGLACLVGGWSYTGAPFRLGYRGLGEVLVLLFFGFVAVTGTFYLHALRLTPLAWLVAVPMGSLISAILVVNNVRDAEGDREAGKRTLAVRLGESFARAEYAALLAVALALPVFLWMTRLAGPAVLLPGALLPWAAILARRMATTRDASVFNRTLGDTGKLQLAYAVLLSVGLVL